MRRVAGDLLLEQIKVFKPLLLAQALDEAAEKGHFASSKEAGAVPGWAITLGAAFKLSDKVLQFGLAPCTDHAFCQALVASAEFRYLN